MAKRAHSKADAVYSEVKDAILSGALEMCGPIDNAESREKPRVSRFPASAAVSRLACGRLVGVAPSHGAFVARLSLVPRMRAAAPIEVCGAETAREAMMVRLSVTRALLESLAKERPGPFPP